MNILLVTNQLAVGGAESFLVRLAGELSRRGHLVGVAALDGELVVALAPSVRYYRAPARPDRAIGFLRLAEWLHGVIRAHAPHVIHANSSTSAAASWLARGMFRVPIVASAHGAWYGARRHVAARLYGAFSDVVVGCSQNLTDDLVACGLPRHKARVVLNGVPRPDVPGESRSAARRELGIAANAPVILTVARLDPMKGQDVLMRAFAEVRRAQPQARLLVAGEGDFRSKLEAVRSDLGLEAAISLLGFRADVNRLLTASDIFCLPSFHEGLPLAVCEAMAAGCPVVVTSVGGVPEVVRDDVTGWLVAPRDAAALAGRLLSALTNPVARARVGEAARLHAERFLSLEHMATEFETLYSHSAVHFAEALA